MEIKVKMHHHDCQWHKSSFYYQTARVTVHRKISMAHFQRRVSWNHKYISFKAQKALTGEMCP